MPLGGAPALLWYQPVASLSFLPGKHSMIHAQVALLRERLIPAWSTHGEGPSPATVHRKSGSRCYAGRICPGFRHPFWKHLPPKFPPPPPSPLM